MSTPVLRFAPSPNGWLHLGHAVSALVGYRVARRTGGRFLLRIEDIDISRTRPEYVMGIEEDLRWLGIDWDGPVRRQSDRFPAYAAAAQRLTDLGVLYPCFATRTEIAAAAGHDAPRDPDGAPLYPGLHRHLDAREADRRRAAGERVALRIDMRRALQICADRLGAPLTWTHRGLDGRERIVTADAARWGDAVIVRKDTPASYHLAVVVDDADQGVTWVTRGTDLEPATDVHRVLQVLLDLPEPVYWHHALLHDEGGRKLSKSAGDRSLRELRESGLRAADLVSELERRFEWIRAFKD